MNNQYSLRYITEFSYCGGSNPELDRKVDFNIANSVAFVRFLGWQPIGSVDIQEFYLLWEVNFFSYTEIAVFNVVEVNKQQNKGHGVGLALSIVVPSYDSFFFVPSKLTIKTANCLYPY